MLSRLAMLKRLMGIYAVVEDMHSAELQRTAAAVREVRDAIGNQRVVARSARVDHRDALEAGDGLGRKMAEALCEAANLKRQRLEPIHVERESFRDAASRQYAASRLKSEQMQRMVTRAAEQAAIEEERKMQAASDDRFLARRCWKDARTEIERTGD